MYQIKVILIFKRWFCYIFTALVEEIKLAFMTNTIYKDDMQIGSRKKHPLFVKTTDENYDGTCQQWGLKVV